MKKNRHIRLSILTLKAFLYRISRICSNFLLFGLILKNWNKALNLSIWLAIVSTVQYFIFDFFFNKIFAIDVQTQGKIIWLTGLSGSGKTTIANRLQENLIKKGKMVQQLDGDILRKTVISDLGFSLEDRTTNLKRAIEVAKLLAKNNVMVICSFISPIREVRKHWKKNIDNFIEVYVNAPLATCEKRDVKGLYKKARKGEIENFTGISQKYEEPLNADIVCYTKEEELEESVTKILKYLKI